MRGLHLVLVTKRNVRCEEVSYARSARSALGVMGANCNT